MRCDRASVMRSGDGTTGTTAVEEESSEALMMAVTSGNPRGYVGKRSACASVSSSEGMCAAGAMAQTDEEGYDPQVCRKEAAAGGDGSGKGSNSDVGSSRKTSVGVSSTVV